MNTAKYKLHLAEVIISCLEPIKKKFNDLQNNPEHLEEILSAGSDKASEIAEKTMDEVKRAIGMKG